MALRVVYFTDEDGDRVAFWFFLEPEEEEGIVFVYAPSESASELPV